MGNWYTSRKHLHLPGPTYTVSDVLCRLEPAGNSASALAGCGGSGAWEAAVVEFACRVQPGGAQEFGPAMLGSLQHVATEWGVDRLADGGGSPAAWLQVVAYVRQVLQFAARTQVHTSLVQDKQQGAWLLAMLQAACTHEGLGVRYVLKMTYILASSLGFVVTLGFATFQLPCA